VAASNGSIRPPIDGRYVVSKLSRMMTGFGRQRPLTYRWQGWRRQEEKALHYAAEEVDVELSRKCSQYSAQIAGHLYAAVYLLPIYPVSKSGGLAYRRHWTSCVTRTRPGSMTTKRLYKLSVRSARSFTTSSVSVERAVEG
jgi:hypothetical protein